MEAPGFLSEGGGGGRKKNLITAAMIALMGGDKTERTEQSVFDPGAARPLTLPLRRGNGGGSS